MMVPARQRGQILILLAGWLFFGGGASSALVVYDRPASDMKKTVKRVITDADRRDAILSDLSEWKSAQKKQDKKVRSDRKDLFKILARQSSQRSEAEPLMARLDDRFAWMDKNFLDFRFRVKGQVSSAEWAQLVARPDH